MQWIIHRTQKFLPSLYVRTHTSTMRYGFILEVSFAEKDQAKELGARWNPRLKKWYVPDNLDIAAFNQWVPEEPEEIFAYAPLYLVKSSEGCWKCGQSAEVYCLASEGFESGGYFHEDFFVTYGSLETVPASLRQHFMANCPSYREDYSKTAGGRYCMNHCSCGAKLGDFYLHNEPGGAFFPTSETVARDIELKQIHDLGTTRIEILAGPGQQYPNLIWQFARKS